METSRSEGANAPWMWAVLAVVLVGGWQALTVQANYAGNWTGLFRVGATMPEPEKLAAGTFRNPHPSGYDGQFYRLLAHDPWLREGTAAYLDSPVRRARRILIPMMAWALGLGQTGLIDYAYILLILASIFGGVYFLGRVMVWEGLPAPLGLLFLAVPATLVGIDTLTVDVSLAALTACFLWQSLTGRERGLWVTLAAAGLIRETGLLLVVSCALAALLRREFRKAFVWASAALPAALWYGYAQLAVPRSGWSHALVPRWMLPKAQLGFLARALDPPAYPQLGGALEQAVRALDVLALLAMGVAAALALLRLRTWRPAAPEAALGLYAALLLGISNKDFWTTPYGYSRPFAPLFVLLLAGDVRRRSRRAWVCAAGACALVDVRVAAEMKTQAAGVLRWLGIG